MPHQRRIQPGDHLIKFAQELGLPDTKSILEIEANADFRDRPHPEMMDPGELLTVPDVQHLKFELATGKRHTLTIPRLKPKLCVAFTTLAGKPVAATAAKVTCKGERAQTKSLSDGVLEMAISATCAEVEVELPAAEEHKPAVQWRLRLGHLLRNESDDGMFARLGNLGYYRKVSRDADTRERRSAVEEFQLAHEMKITGQLDEATRTKIVEVYGC